MGHRLRGFPLLSHQGRTQSQEHRSGESRQTYLSHSYHEAARLFIRLIFFFFEKKNFKRKKKLFLIFFFFRRKIIFQKKKKLFSFLFFQRKIIFQKKEKLFFYFFFIFLKFELKKKVFY